MSGGNPRCVRCGQFMELYRESATTVEYECCGRSVITTASEMDYTLERNLPDRGRR